MCYKFNSLLYLIIFIINIKILESFNVNFYYNYNLQAEPFNTQIYKRELTQYFDKALFTLNGFEKVESVPILFPIDICILNLEGTKYATTLHMKKNGSRHFEVLKMHNGSYELIVDILAPNAIAMDCTSFHNKGYVAIAFNLTEPVKHAKEGSPLYEITGNRLTAVQYFSGPYLLSVYLRVSGNDFFLLHTYANSKDTPNLHCPYFKWSGSTFNKMGYIPCSNARQLTPFSIDYESYVAVANYADQSGRTTTNSEIYKFSRDKKKFVLFQKIKTNGAVDVQYFNVPLNEVKRQHFLVFGNSISTTSLAKREKAKREGTNLDADSVFYIFDKGQFIPYQKLSLYAVKKFLPVQNIEAEKFILLVACTDQDIKIYNLNDWKFEESKVQFTDGALGKGVANMRIYQENEKSYLIIANELMTDNETNVFLPIFKQEEHANILRQQIIDWAKAETQRMQTINIQDLRKQVEKKLKHFEVYNDLRTIKDITEANIQTVTTESLVYPKMKMSGNYWTALNYVNQALDSLDVLLKQKQRLKRQVDNPYSYENLEYIYETLDVKTLTVNSNLKAKRVNKVNTENPEFENINTHKVIVTDKYIKPSRERFNLMENSDYVDESEGMRVRNLQINGNLNEIVWTDLLNNTLKCKGGIQFLKAPIHITNLKSDTIVVNNDKVNEQNLGALIPVDGGKYVVNQDIQFAAPIVANKIQIFDRLNNLHVFNGQFDILLKKSNKTQVIEGLKNINKIKVMEPITIAGKMMGHQLDAISPKKVIHDHLILQGNFMINGNVHIKDNVTTLDVVDLKQKLSTKQVLDMGIRMDKSLKDVHLKFLQPLKANNSLVGFVNQHDIQRLVKLNQDAIQIIEGEKIFSGSLEIKRGFSEVKNINGVDMEQLEADAFLKNNNQTIRVPMKLGKMTAKSMESPLVILNDKNLSDYLTLNGNQIVQGSLLIDNLKVKTLKAEHVYTNNKIFQQHLIDIYQQKSRNAPQENIFKKNRKFHGTIYAQNLILNTTINNINVEEIENHLLLLDGNIKYVGNFKFNYPMNITNMTFMQKFNDIHAEDFGKCWLQKSADKQVFTAPQTFATIEAEEGIQLTGKLNGFAIGDFYTKTYWINRDEYIRNINFENPIEVAGFLTTSTLNEYHLPQDIFYKFSKEAPITLKSLIVDEDVFVEGGFVNISSINDLNLCAVHAYLDSTNLDTLYVENAYFSQTLPLYKTLNSYHIKQMLDAVWLANEDVILPYRVEIADAYFEGLLEFEGPINNINLAYMNENYFSKSKPQEISIEMILSGGAKCEQILDVNELYVFGPLVEGKSGSPINFDDFVHNTLKSSGLHIISGKWSLLKANILGNLNGVLINQLNFVDDVVHTVKPLQAYELKASKLFKNAYIENLYANPFSFINKIPVANWISDAVYLYENYTIQGVTKIDSINVYNDLIALGNLNNITFNMVTLFLKDENQLIPGNVKIISHLVNEKRFLTNNIEHLYADHINQQQISEFMENVISANKNIEIKSHMVFKNPVKVEQYEGPEGFLTQNQWTKRNTNEHTQLNRVSVESADAVLEKFIKVKNYFKNIVKGGTYKLDHFAVFQMFDAKSPEIVTLSIKSGSIIIDILAIINIQQRKTTIYKWLPEVNIFQETRDYNWLPNNPILMKIIQKRFDLCKQPIDEENLKAFIKLDLNKLFNALPSTNYLNNYYEFSNNTCMIYHTTSPESTKLHTYCSNIQQTEKIITLPYEIQQILSIDEMFVVLLTNNSVFVYNTSSEPVDLLQKLVAPNPKQIALGRFQNNQYLAVLSYPKDNTLTHGYVEVYRSVDASAFTLFQILECFEPVKMKFSYIEKSNDFLLYLLTNSLLNPYLIYQYQGVMGFKEILTASTLPTNFTDLNQFRTLSSEQYFVALLGKTGVTLVEIVLSQML